MLTWYRYWQLFRIIFLTKTIVQRYLKWVLPCSVERSKTDNEWCQGNQEDCRQCFIIVIIITMSSWWLLIILQFGDKEDALIPVDVSLVEEIWMPDIEILNLKQVVLRNIYIYKLPLAVLDIRRAVQAGRSVAEQKARTDLCCGL